MRNFSNVMMAAAVVVGVPSAALADSDSLFTLGVGSALSVAPQTAAESTPTGELRLKARALRVLGAELGYHPVPAGLKDMSDDAARLTAYLHLVPTSPVGLYIKAGMGSESFEKLRTWDWLGSSYHAGAGLEVHLFDHFVILLEGMAHLPTPKAIFANMPEGQGFDPVAQVKQAIDYRGAIGLMLFI